MALVLVVDDVPENRRLLAVILERCGYQTITAPSGEEALRLIEEARPDLVLLDIMMPGMDGFDVLCALREQPVEEPPPVVVVSAVADPAARERAKRLGASDYLVKAGFDVEQLLEIVRRLAA